MRSLSQRVEFLANLAVIFVTILGAGLLLVRVLLTRDSEDWRPRPTNGSRAARRRGTYRSKGSNGENVE